MNATERGRLRHVVSMVYGRPWFLREAEFRTMDEIVQFHVAGGRLSADEIQERLDAAAARNGPRNGARTSGTVGIIPIYGMIFPRASLMTEMSGGTSISDIRAAFRMAQADEAVGSILFDVDSPGGFADGIEELAAEIRDARGRKPMVAIANYGMASAAYYLGAQADEVVASPSSMVGWIGTVMVHQEFSKMDEQAGVTTRIFRDPAGKFGGNEFEPLSDKAAADFQRDVGDFSTQFVNAVAKGRGVSVATVRADFGEGGGMTAARAKAAGLVDRVETFDATVGRLAGNKVQARIAAAAWPTLPTGGSSETVSVGGGTWVWDNASSTNGPEIAAGPIKSHTTATTDEPWDGPANEARLPSESGPLHAAHAWVDEDADPDAKASYKFIHHRVSESGAVGAANTNGCSNGIAVLNGGRGGANIPDGDRPGVHAHLARHIEDAGKDAPPLSVAGAREAEAALALARAQVGR